MGSSRDIAIGPVAVVSLLLGTLLQNEIPDSQANYKLAYRRLAFTATFFAGITQFALGFFRSVLCCLADFFTDNGDSNTNDNPRKFDGFSLLAYRLGFLIDFLSHAAIVGFMAGASVTIALQQLKGLLGINNFTKKTDIVSVMRSVGSSAHHGVYKIKKILFIIFLILFFEHLSCMSVSLFE